MAATGVNLRVVVWVRKFPLRCSQGVDRQLSEEVRVASGVPQGSVLGPMLFLAHVNIWRNTESNIRLFAAIIYRKITDRSDIDKLQKDRTTLDEWAVENEIKINPGKIKQ